MSTPSYSGAIDLSGLSAQTTITAPPKVQIPDGAFACEVPGGCNLVVMGDRTHEVINDCLDTCFPYVERYLETREAAVEVAEEYHNAVAQFRTVLAANQRLADENDDLKAQLREARRGTPAAEKHVLAGAEDLAASMKANFGTREPLPDLEEIHGSPVDECECCGKKRPLPFNHRGTDYCQECYDAGCSVNDPTGGCVL